MSGMGSRIIFKSRYVKPGRNKSGGTGRYAQYIGTREGAVKMTDSQKDKPATAAQKKFIKQLTKDVPQTKQQMTYYEYEQKPTLGKASAFISDSVDQHGEKIIGLEGYAQYMATRPMANKERNTGLFSDGNEPVDLNEIKEELKNYTGNVYLPIISLRPEDSISLGYDNPETWHNLVERHLDAFAKEYRIPREHLRWVGAYHNAVNKEGVIHNHIHMIIWSTNPSEGWQDKETGNNLRKVLAQDIFKEELKDVYEQKTQNRDEVKALASARLKNITEDIDSAPNDNVVLQNQIKLLAEKIKDVKGRKYYSYMPADVKKMVNGIVDSLPATDPKIKAALDAWAETKDKQIKVYSDGEYVMPPLSQISDFKSIKNELLKEADRLNKVQAEQAKQDAKDKEAVKRNTEKQSYSKTSMVRAADRLTSTMARLFQTKSGGRGKNDFANLDEKEIERLRSLGQKL